MRFLNWANIIDIKTKWHNNVGQATQGVFLSNEMFYLDSRLIRFFIFARIQSIQYQHCQMNIEMIFYHETLMNFAIVYFMHLWALNVCDCYAFMRLRFHAFPKAISWALDLSRFKICIWIISVIHFTMIQFLEFKVKFTIIKWICAKNRTSSKNN